MKPEYPQIRGPPSCVSIVVSRSHNPNPWVSLSCQSWCFTASKNKSKSNLLGLSQSEHVHTPCTWMHGVCVCVCVCECLCSLGICACVNFTTLFACVWDKTPTMPFVFTADTHTHTQRIRPAWQTGTRYYRVCRWCFWFHSDFLLAKTKSV